MFIICQLYQKPVFLKPEGIFILSQELPLYPLAQFERWDAPLHHTPRS